MKWIILIFMLFSLGFVGAEDVFIELEDYTPRPVIPGEEFTVTFLVVNQKPVNGSSLEVEVSVNDNGVFTVQGKDKKILTFSNVGEKLVSFDILAGEDVDKKTEGLDVELCVDDDCEEETFTIRIKQDVSLIIESIEVPDSFEPGEIGLVNVVLSNEGNFKLDKVVVNLDLSSGEMPFSFTEAGSERIVSMLNVGESETVSFDILAEDIANSGVYKVPLTVTYSDADGEEFKLNDFVSLKVSTFPDILVSLGDEDLVINRGSKVTLNVVNKGLGDAEFLRVKMLEGKGYDLLKSGEVYVGDVDSDDFEVVEFMLLPYKTEIEIPLYLEYKDSGNKLYTEMVYLRPMVYTLDEAKDLGIIKKSSAWIFAVIAVIVFLFVIYRKRKKKR